MVSRTSSTSWFYWYKLEKVHRIQSWAGGDPQGSPKSSSWPCIPTIPPCLGTFERFPNIKKSILTVLITTAQSEILILRQKHLPSINDPNLNQFDMLSIYVLIFFERNQSWTYDLLKIHLILINFTEILFQTKVPKHFKCSFLISCCFPYYNMKI